MIRLFRDFVCRLGTREFQPQVVMFVGDCEDDTAVVRGTWDEDEEEGDDEDWDDDDD